MELVLVVATSLSLGALLSLFVLINMIFKSHQKLVDAALQECKRLERNIAQKTEEFADVTAKASAANMSLGTAITDFDMKIKDLESRIAMSRMQQRP